MGEDDLKVTHFLYDYFVFETMSHNVAQDDLEKKNQDQAGLELREICVPQVLCCPPACHTKLSAIPKEVGSGCD